MKEKVSTALALVIGGVLGALLLGEMVIAFVKPQPVLMTTSPGIFFIRHDPAMGWANLEGADGPYNPAQGIPQTRVTINAQGERNRLYPTEKGKGVRRILVLGDSNAFGYGVDESKRFSDLLAADLPPSYQVINLGVFGYATDQEALLLEQKIAAYKPDLVILAYSPGDLSENTCSVNTGAGKPFFRMEGEQLSLHNVPVPETSPYLTLSMVKSRLISGVYRHSHLFRLAVTLLSQKSLHTLSAVSEMSEKEGMPVTVNLIQGMQFMSRDNGARFVVMLLPHGSWLQSLIKFPGHAVGYYPIFKAQLEQRKIPLVDTMDTFVAAAKRGEEVFFKSDPVHLTAQGNAVVAEKLRQELFRLRLLAVP